MGYDGKFFQIKSLIEDEMQRIKSDEGMRLKKLKEKGE